MTSAVRELRAALYQPALSLPQIVAAERRIADPGFASEWDGPCQRIAVAGSLTTDFIAKAVACAVFREGVLPTLYSALYGAYVQEVLDPSSGLRAFRPELTLLAPDRRDLVTAMPLSASVEDVGRAVDAKLDGVERLWDTLAANGCAVVQHLLVPPPTAPRGLAERRVPATERAQVERLNDALLERGRGRVTFVEVDRLADEVGTARWAPERFFVNAKLPFDPQFTAAYLRIFGGAWRQANARVRKALVLDLDNTLWGGVIGDDGIHGIALGCDTPAGEAFARWGAYVKQLADRGVVLAVCSKNDPEIAATAFAHPAQVLALNDFGAFECSWDDKVAGVRRVAAKLNLALDALVFADDNPAECELVRRALPEVAVVELGTDPTQFIARLEAERWFDVTALTGEDLARVDAYAARRRVDEAREHATDIGAFLADLDMRATFAAAAPSQLARVAQLESKTNQFNLTTRRYDEATVERLAARPDVTVFVFGLRDRYGDHGLVSSLIVVRDGTTLRIDSWLMSCRVFSRTAEEFIIGKLIAAARDGGIERIVGEYEPTAKNGVVAGLYGRLGFAAAGHEGRRWVLDVREAAASPALPTYVRDDVPAAAVPAHGTAP